MREILEMELSKIEHGMGRMSREFTTSPKEMLPQKRSEETEQARGLFKQHVIKMLNYLQQDTKSLERI